MVDPGTVDLTLIADLDVTINGFLMLLQMVATTRLELNHLYPELTILWLSEVGQ